MYVHTCVRIYIYRYIHILERGRLKIFQKRWEPKKGRIWKGGIHTLCELWQVPKSFFVVNVFFNLKLRTTQSLLLCLLNLISTYVYRCPGGTFFAKIYFSKWCNPSDKSRDSTNAIMWKSSFTCLEHTATRY